MQAKSLFFSVALLLAGCDANLTGVPFFGAPDFKPAQERFVRATQQDRNAFEELVTAAAKGDTPSAFFAGLLNDPGFVTKGDFATALTLYEAATKSYTGATHNMALLLLKSNEPKAGQQAIELLEQAGSKGRRESMLLAGSLLENGWTGITPNPARAVDWFEKAVTTYKDPRAELKLGTAFMDGRGRDQDSSKALMYLTAAAKDGMVEAQYRLASLAENQRVATQWLLIAASSDSSYSKEASASLSRFNAQGQFEIRRNAQMWLHAHGSAVNDVKSLNAFSEPLREP